MAKAGASSQELKPIACTNGESLDEICDIVRAKVSKFAEENKLKNKEAFIARFTETFSDTLQKNVTVNGLPWVAGKGRGPSTDGGVGSTPAETEEVTESQLREMMETVAHKRKTVPKECRKLLRGINHQFTEKVNQGQVKADLPPPSVDFSPLDDQSQLGKLKEMDEENNLLQQNINSMSDQMAQIREKLDYLSVLERGQRTLMDDTGYTSDS